ncbi:MAG TPA: PIN domain-containing protein [Gemmatimonadota bacterium]|nr:PIN domain-containing protein [Gemmatimonadota bacterium]
MEKDTIAISRFKATCLAVMRRVKRTGRPVVVTRFGEPGEWVRDALASSSMREAALNHEVALEGRRVRLPHPDPADRFLAATARVYELTLVTADRRLLDARACRTLSAG